jgi:HPt (histidine-containing phosphotransfer) domain-containing protein
MKTDLSYLKEMSAGNKELVLEMIDIFKSQVEEFKRDMLDLYSKKEYQLLGKLAHKAKSSISIMGLSDLANDLKTLENNAKAGIKTESYKKIIDKFIRETDEAVSELNQVSKNLDSIF